MADEDGAGPVSGRAAFTHGIRGQLGHVTRTTEVRLDRAAWRKLAYNVLRTEGVERMTRVRDACREQSGFDSYMLSTEGPRRLPGFAPIVTVITADIEAITDNARHNTLLANFHLAGGDS